jgi:hypothetical protein
VSNLQLTFATNGWKNRGKMNIYHSLSIVHPLMGENLVVFVTALIFFTILHQLCQLYNMMTRPHVGRLVFRLGGLYR